LLGDARSKLSDWVDLQAAEQKRAADECQECGKIETIDPNNDGVVVCVFCGTRR
jgi:ribosomal protein L37AE/L43A